MSDQTTDYGDGNDFLARLKAEQAEKRRLEQMPSRKMTVAERFAELDGVSPVKRPKKVKTEKLPPEAAPTGKHKKSSEFLGVCRNRTNGGWTACIKVNGNRHVKYTETEKGAAVEYDLMSVKYRGKDGKTNFPIENYTIPPTAAELEYEDRDVVISTACIRSAMIAYVNARGTRRCSTLPNYILMEELFFFGKSCENRDEIMKNFGIKNEIHY